MKALRDQLREWKKQIKQTKENFSTREIEDLMGKYRPCYERRRGALRQK
ncbi:phage protein [Bacillus cereus]|nr:phage protein [Bacillus cereus]